MEALKHALAQVELVAISILLGHLAVQHVAPELKQEPLLILVPTSPQLNLKSALTPKDIMAPGLAGLLAVLHAVVDIKQEVNLIHVAVKIMSKNVHVTKMQVFMVPGVNGLLVLSLVVAVTSFVNVFTVVLVRFKLIQNFVTLIHVLIMAPGLIGRHAVPHVVLELCPVCDIATVVALVPVCVSMVMCPQMK